MVHVSTAYNNLDKESIEELIYPTPITPRKLLEIVDCLDADMLRSITGQWVTFWPTIWKEISHTRACWRVFCSSTDTHTHPSWPNCLTVEKVSSQSVSWWRQETSFSFLFLIHSFIDQPVGCMIMITLLSNYPVIHISFFFLLLLIIIYSPTTTTATTTTTCCFRYQILRLDARRT